MENHIQIIAFTVVVGTLARFMMLKLDYRQYPTYPHGALAHLSLGFIAAGLGSVAIPALIEKDFAAVTFLALAAQQFRDIRNIERETLSKLENAELVPRGPDFIEGVARAFEARNYLVILVTIFTSAVTWLINERFGIWWAYLGGLAFAIILVFLAIRYMEGKRIIDIADVDEGRVHFDKANLFVDDIHIMNLGIIESKEIIEKRALGVIIRPKDKDAVPILANVGQRQALVHIASKLMGIHKEVDSAEFTPMARRDLDKGTIALIIVPTHGDIEDLIDAVERTPVLESAISKPSAAGIVRLNEGKGE
ncbi:YIEGIA domain-containing protein [Alkalicella caledoniensis]|uniref:YIEGIA domain-containing protein n=1 Tax=Alkalicella caledoniensis TaxID=2731377 RepID=A0A7G9W4C1_ALKCA|nr:YIEGIA family protein [Alkalicella caledoniensis]QNO13533.1 YIEGIA domain-containing protein [Alkalicella caledoniensis]